MKRRHFLTTAPGIILSSPLLLSALGNEGSKQSVAIIGHTGRGGFGHGLDTVWTRFPETEIVAVADANPAGLEEEKKKLNVKNGFSDYHVMLEQVKPDFAAVCPRHIDQHLDMILAAIQAGVKGIYIEKPFCRTPEEADQIVAESRKHNTKIAVAHRNRYHPVIHVINRMIDDGELGQVLEIRGRGKGDRRGGAEDLWVLGSHVLNLVMFFGGKPKSCSAVMLQDGRPVTKSDVRDGAEGLGPLAGNELHARFELDKGITAYFDSIADDGTQNAGFGLQIIGSKGTVSIQCDREPLAWLIPGNPFMPKTEPQKWIPISTAGVGKPETRKDLIHDVQHHDTAIRDLIDSVKEDREPLCNAEEAALIIEAIFSVFESHRQDGLAVSFPLKNRKNALSML